MKNAIERIVERSCAAQGVPVRVDDASTLARVAALLDDEVPAAQADRSRASPRRAA